MTNLLYFPCFGMSSDGDDDHGSSLVQDVVVEFPIKQL